MRTFLSTVHPDDREYVDKEWKAGLAGEPYDIEHRIIVDGKIKWVREKAYLEFDKDGAVVGGFGITQDITERKQAEERTRQRVEELEKMMDVVPVAIFIGHDPKCHNITGNQMANEFFKAKLGENVSPDVSHARRLFNKGIELTADKLPMQKAALKDIDVRNEELDFCYYLVGNGEDYWDQQAHCMTLKEMFAVVLAHLWISLREKKQKLNSKKHLKI